jgi:hypothetical protein
LPGRISADDEEVGRGLHAAMAGARREHHNISGIDSELVPSGTTENYARISGGDTEHFVCRGVIVMKIVDPVSPLWRPAITKKSLLEPRGRIGSGQLEDVMVDQDWKSVVVRHPRVTGELQSLWVLEAGSDEERA